MKFYTASSGEGKQFIESTNLPVKLHGRLYLPEQVLPRNFYNQWGFIHGVRRIPDTSNAIDPTLSAMVGSTYAEILEPFIHVDAALVGVTTVDEMPVSLSFIQANSITANSFTTLIVSLFGQSGLEATIDDVAKAILPNNGINLFDTVLGSMKMRNGLFNPMEMTALRPGDSNESSIHIEDLLFTINRVESIHE